MKKARLTKAIRDWCDAQGVEIIKAKYFTEGKHHMIGIHLLCPTQAELEDALNTCERDGFTRIILHSMDSWAPGAMKRQHRPRLTLLQGGAA